MKTQAERTKEREAHKDTIWELGQCCLCHQPIMADGKPTDQYDQIQVLLSNGTKMDVGICKSCKADGVDDADFKKLMQSTVEGWEAGLVKDKQMAEKKKIEYRMAFYGVRILGITKQ